MRSLDASARITLIGFVVLCVSMLVGSRDAFLGIATAAAIPLMFALVASSMFRLVLVIGGALLVFQTSATLPKFAYLFLAFVCFAVSALALARDNNPAARITRPFIFCATVVAVVVAVSLGTAHSYGISTSTWFRDVLAYILLIILPVVGIDAGHQLRRQTIDRAIVVLGVLAAAGFATDYLNRRGVSTLGFGRFLLATPTLAALGFVHALVIASRKNTRTIVWMSAAVVIATLLIVTGTRSNLILIAAFPAIVGARRKGRIPPIRMARLLIPVVVATVVLVPFVGARLINNPAFLSHRFDAAISVLRSGSNSGDQSLLIREQAYQWAHEQFSIAKWLGTGPGHAYPTGVTSLDTPWIVLAKFGLIGTGAIVVYLLAGAYTVIRSRRLVGYQYAHTTVRGWAVVLAFLTPFGPWVEDKGAALALALVMAMLVSYTREPEQMPDFAFTGDKVPTLRPLAPADVSTPPALATSTAG